MTSLRWLVPVVALATVLYTLAGCDDELGAYCPRPFERCGTENTCTDTRVDSKNCGTCGTTCASGERCLDSKCVIGCGGGATECSGKCVDTGNDLKNCGKCGTTCKTGELCSQGKCGSSCAGGTTNCSGKCVDTQVDKANCGACGTICKKDELCSASKCATTCYGGTTKCGAKCVDTQLDPTNCGGCGTACKTGEVCSSGSCSTKCGTGATICYGKCVNTQTDPASCGACGTACKTNEVCSAGKCGMSCGFGTTKCDTKCVDTDTDPAHCGKCASACGTGEVCSLGKCGLKCVGGTTKCGTACVDTYNDSNHCGKCNTPCAGKCSLGKCLCGNGTVDKGEQCDGSAMAGKACGTYGYSLGTLACKQDCTLDTDNCTWAMNMGGKGVAKRGRIAVDGQGNTYVTGEFYKTATFGKTTLTSKGDADILVAKLDPDGLLLWAKGAGEADSDRGRHVVVDATGNVYVTGIYKGAVDFGGTKLTAKSTVAGDVFVWKLDTNGATVYAVSAGGGDYTEGLGLTVDSAGKAVVVGAFSGTAMFGTHSVKSAGGNDGFIARLDTKGAFTWAGRLGGADNDWAQRVVLDGAGNAFVTGAFRGTDATFIDAATKATNSLDSAFVLKVDGTGKVGWLKVPTAPTESRGEGIGLDGAGNVYVAGGFTGTMNLDTKALKANANLELFVWKMDGAGKHTWAFQTQADDQAYAHALAVDTAGNAYVGGIFENKKVMVGGNTLPIMNGKDALVFKLDPGGKLQWVYPGYSSEDAELYGLAIGPTDLHVSGEFKMTFTAGAKTLVSPKYSESDDDIFVWTLPKNCTGAACAKPCGTNLTTCSGACVNLQTDEQNCGACGTSCKVGESCCGGTCLDLLVSNTHCGKCGNTCGASSPCTKGVCVSTDKKVVFITSQTFNGNLGGVTGADAKCNTAATTAKITGKFYAWLGQGSSPKSWPGYRVKKHSGDFVDRTGRVLARSTDKLAAGPLAFPVEFDEDAKKVTGDFWSNVTFSSGLVYAISEDCAGWNWGKDGTYNGRYAKATAATSGYKFVSGDTVAQLCGKSLHLICVQQ